MKILLKTPDRMDEFSVSRNEEDEMARSLHYHTVMLAEHYGTMGQSRALELNRERRINRILMLSVGWAVCCLLLYPLVQREQARRFYEHDTQRCFWGPIQDSPEHCRWVALNDSGISDWSMTTFYQRESWHLAVVVVAMPLIAYGLYFGAVVGRNGLGNPKS
jgi:hypothetical protein